MNIVVFYHNDKLYELKRNAKSQGAEQFAKIVMKDDRLKKLTVFTLGSLMYCNNVLANDAADKIDVAGWKILNIARSVGYWVCLVMCITEIIKTIMEGNAKNITKIMMKYALAFAALYFFPWILDLIKEIFS